MCNLYFIGGKKMACMHKETFDIYHNEYNILYDGYVEIDELIAPSIQILNRKGYKTRHCCSGHSLTEWLFNEGEAKYRKSRTAPDSYISFEEGITLPILPPGFAIDDSENRWLVIRKFDYAYYYSDIELSRLILEAMEQLYEWALDLPDFKS
jgi:hypothetical protein